MFSSLVEHEMQAKAMPLMLNLVAGTNRVTFVLSLPERIINENTNI